MLKLIPLGGLGEIGLNMMVLEYEQYILVIDAGLMFPEEYMPGVDVVIPDIQYLKDNREKVKSIILTHGHEDHIGAMPFFLKDLNIPVFGTSFTIELVKEKLIEHNLLHSADLRKIKAGDQTTFGPFEVEYIAVNHSIVDGVGLAINTPEGIIIHSGDFKIDQTPVDGRFTDLGRFAHYGEAGVLALLSDSTNVEKEGFTLSEKEVMKTLETLFESSSGRLVVAVFASNIGRIQQVVNLAVKYGRKIHFSGRSMKANVRIAKEEGFLSVPDNVEISESAIESLPDKEIVIITTGSQGEPMSSLTRMAQSRHKNIKIRKGDTIILSSRFIPGNEKAITAIINSLYRMGADVVYEKVSDIHSSGHAYKEELKLMLNLVNPRYFIPVHGEYRHLVKHIQLAMETGMPEDRLILAEDGTAVLFENGQAAIGETVHTGRILVDGKGVGDVGDLVLRDRRRLSGDGVVIVLLAVSEQTGEIIYGPEILSRGFVFEDQGGFILEEAKCIVLEIFDEIKNPSHLDWTELGPEIKRNLKSFFYDIIERRPLILPVIIPL
ncbi:MAG: ribonuclease J [Deltaproteobacteria bacterium]|nr:ribonuclease J [Deltaproteobacteria bacterium]MBW1935789.1 ribonuclease J [Deltaproteobacteria bacterium]MBW1978908.1 ribonuclease J [Deltaproteobacteria bacterium]MBW2045438.1 ribonuclease J [Deltaproteobacteria bacterium]MBW2301855.1 ribonuclease J [Deltaproteobacteria bacterium]